MNRTQGTSTSLSKQGLAHLSVVYLVWSSTYLAIRIAVQEGSGFPPFAMGAIRMAAAGMILLLLARFSGFSLRMSRQDLIRLSVSGILLWVGGNGLVVWAEQHVASGYAALMVASSPIWVAFLNALWSKKRPSWLLIGSLLLGFFGLCVLLAPTLLNSNPGEFTAGLALLAASISWSAGSLYQTRFPIQKSAVVISAYQHVFAAAGFFLVFLLAGEPIPHPTHQAWAAWGYLVIFGSVLAFTSFITALQLLPINIAMTYSYVNPVLAVFLGWWLLNEQITGWTIAGAALVICGVFGVFQERLRQSPPSADQDQPDQVLQRE